MYLSVLSIIIPFLYFVGAVWLERKFYHPDGALSINFYIFIFGIAGAAVIIPLFFKILKCSFVYWHLLISIIVALVFGYIASLIVFRTVHLESDPIFSSEIIFSVQILACTVFAVIGTNRNIWECVADSQRKKEVVQSYRRFETAINADPVDIITVYTIAESDYRFAKEYLKKSNALDLLYRTAKKDAASGKITQEEYRNLAGIAASGEVRDAAVDCARYYIGLSDDELIALSADEKAIAVSVLDTLGKQTDADTVSHNLWIILRARLHTNMIVSEVSSQRNIKKLNESCEQLKMLLGTTPDSALSASAKYALDHAEAAIHRFLLNDPSLSNR